MPTISCVIPVYNDKLHLPRAVKSALEQRPDVQVVLVDDCSTDGSRELALEMARDDRRIIAIPLPSNSGQAYARNIGVAAAHAPYVTFLDQDDEHAPDWYNHAIEVLQANPGFAAVRGEIELMEVPVELDISPTDPRRLAMVNSTVWNMVIRKVAYQALGGSPTSPTFRTREGAEDVTLVVALKQHFRVAKTERLASRHYVKANGATAYFLRRTRIAGNRVEFTELSDEERSGALEKALSEFQAQAEANVRTLRGLLKPRFRGFRELMAEISVRMLRKISGSARG
jgi:glycosyltransferase involved in cell wall biosynthesis